MNKDTLKIEYFNKIMKTSDKYFYIFLNILHIVLVIGTITYPLIFKERSEYDFYFLIFLYIVMLQWILLKNECIINYLEKIKINPNYKLGTNIEGPGLNYILDEFSISMYNQTDDKKLNKERHNLLVPFMTFLMFSCIALRYLKDFKTQVMNIVFFGLLFLILVFKVLTKKLKRF